MDYRENRPQASPYIPQTPYCLFIQPTHSANSMGLEALGLNRHHPLNAGRHQLTQTHILPLLHPHSLPDSFPSPHVNDMHVAIRREIDKEKIREEIIMSEIIRRHGLEAEVRRELMMDREMAQRRGSHGFSIGSSSAMGFDSPMMLPPIEPRAEWRSVEERIVPALINREHLPFQRGSADRVILDVTEVGKEKERITLGVSNSSPSLAERITLASKPNENTSGMKREASKVHTSGSPSNHKSRKKSKDECSCALCKVSCTSEEGLNQHLQGKKHKAKEASLRAVGKKFSIGLLPEKSPMSFEVPPKKSLMPVEVPPKKSPMPVEVHPRKVKKVKSKVKREPLSLAMTGNATSSTDDPLKLNASTNVLNTNEESVAAQKDSNLESKKDRMIWCELCKIGAHSQKVMDSHLNGKKHMKQLQSNKGCGVGLSCEKGVVVYDPADKKLAEGGEKGGVVTAPADEKLAVDGGNVAGACGAGSCGAGNDDIRSPAAIVADEPKPDDDLVVLYWHA